MQGRDSVGMGRQSAQLAALDASPREDGTPLAVQCIQPQVWMTSPSRMDIGRVEVSFGFSDLALSPLAVNSS